MSLAEQKKWHLFSIYVKMLFAILIIAFFCQLYIDKKQATTQFSYNIYLVLLIALFIAFSYLVIIIYQEIFLLKYFNYSAEKLMNEINKLYELFEMSEGQARKDAIMDLRKFVYGIYCLKTTKKP